MENDARDAFMRSRDFMKLGMAVESGNWQIAHMTVNRMQKICKEAAVSDFERNLISLKQCIAARNKESCKDILAVMVGKRVKYLNEAGKKQDSGL